MQINFADLREIWGDPNCQNGIIDDEQILSVCIDSRKIHQRSLFVPIKGNNFNGHEFISDAYKTGAIATIVEEAYIDKVPLEMPYWIVADTLQSYQKLASYYRSKLNIPVIAVTGSVGKTTTRELIKSVLRPLGRIVGTSQNNNNDIGVPLTLFEGDEGDSLYVIEMGMRGLGEIARLSCCAKPDIAVITNVGSSHIGLLGSREKIAIAKCEIVSCLNPDGVLIIPFGDPILEDAVTKEWDGRIVRVGLDFKSFESDLKQVDAITSTLPSPDLVGSFSLQRNALSIEGVDITLPLEGRHNALNFMFAIAVAKELGVSLDGLINLNVDMLEGRNRLIDLGSVVIMDETYNSSPESVKASLELLVTKPGRHFAVLGTMLELGEQSVPLHREIADFAAEIGLDGLILVSTGEEAKAMQHISDKLAMFAQTATPEEAVIVLLDWLEKGDVVLLKASRSIQLEKMLPFLRDETSFAN